MVKNNKGFMLIEVIITSTIVVTSLTFLYSSFSRLYNNFNIKNSYYHLDTAYATKEMTNSLIEYNLLNKIINNKLIDNTYSYIIENNNCLLDTSPLTCSNIKKLYNIENFIITNYKLESLNKIKENTSLNKTFIDYIDYVITYYDLENEEDNYQYIILTESKEKDKYFYSNLRMR